MLTTCQKSGDRNVELISTVEHGVNLDSPAVRLIHSVLYWAVLKAQSFERSRIQIMLPMNAIDSAQTEWPISVVFMPKKDRAQRFCLEFRKRNTRSICKSSRLPRMDRCVSILGSAQAVLILDAKTSYWQIEVNPYDGKKSPITSDHHLY